MKKLSILITCFLLLFINGFAQQNDLYITYYANQGVSGLSGASKVYMYSGAITSSPSGQWEWIIGSPSADDGIGLMNYAGNDTWTICIDPLNYYSGGLGGPIPNGSTIYAIDLFFRNENGTAFGYDLNGTYIVLDLTSTPVTSTFTGVVPGSCAVGIQEELAIDNSIAIYPNPVKGNATLSYTIKKNAGRISVKIFDVLGQKVKTIIDAQNHSTGTQQIIWNGENDNGSILKNGLYFYTLEINDVVVKSNRFLIDK
jgi:hypothetical protein